MSRHGKKLYEETDPVHTVVEQVEGVPHAMISAEKLWLNESLPSALRERARQDPKRPFSTAIPFSIMERYLLSLIDQLEPSRRPTP